MLVAALVVAAACQGSDTGPPSEPAPTPGAQPQGPGIAGPHPCDVLGEAAVSAVVGEDVTEVEATSGEVLALCTYELGDGIGTVDLAVVNLHALAAQGERVTPNGYIAQLRDGAGQGEVAELDGLGGGDAITITYEFGGQAWGWEGMLVLGGYATNVVEPTSLAVKLLEAALDAL